MGGDGPRHVEEAGLAQNQCGWVCGTFAPHTRLFRVLYRTCLTPDIIGDQPNLQVLRLNTFPNTSELNRAWPRVQRQTFFLDPDENPNQQLNCDRC